MKFRLDNKYLHIGITAFSVIAAALLLYYTIFHMSTLIAGIRNFLQITAPIIYGFVIAYILSGVVSFFEDKVIFPFLDKKEINLEKRGKKAIRWVCVIFSLLLLIVTIYTLIMMILPQLIRSITNIIYSFPSYVDVIENWLNMVVEKGWDLDRNAINLLSEYSENAQKYLTGTLLPQLQGMLLNISSGVFNVLNVIKNFLIGAVISIYLLVDKELFIAKGKMILYALFSTEHANAVIHAFRFTHNVFGGFISGKLLDSAIIGILCYIGITIMRMPYAILVSVIIGVTNVIPFFGPYLGAIPTSLLILLVDPQKGLYFILFILILQQFDGNVLGPKILGDSTGLSSFMVIVAILIGGGLFGIGGMIIGVPICAVIYATLNNILNNALKDKELATSEEVYKNIDCLDPDTLEVLPLENDPTIRQQKREERHNMFTKARDFVLWLARCTMTQVLILLMLSEDWIGRFSDKQRQRYDALQLKRRERIERRIQAKEARLELKVNKPEENGPGEERPEENKQE